MDTPQWRAILTQLTHIEHQVKDLHQKLDLEKQALVERDIQQLQQLTQQKEQSIQQLKQLQDSCLLALKALYPSTGSYEAALQQWLDDAPIPLREETHALKQRLAEALKTVQNLNAVIGQIINRSRSSNQRLLNIFKGMTEQSTTYSHAGKLNSGSYSKGLARA